MPMLEPGHYKCKLEDAEIRASSTDKSTPCFFVMVHILEGANKGERLPHELWLTDKAITRSVKTMAHSGCTFPPDPASGSDEPDLENFEGFGTKEMMVEIEHEEYQPEATTEQKAKNETPKPIRRPAVKYLNPMGFSNTTKRIDKAQQKMIAKSWAGSAKAALAELRSGKGSTSGGGNTSFDTKTMDAQSSGAPVGTPKKLY